MKQAIPGMRLAWQGAGTEFIIAVLANGGQLIFEFHLEKGEVQSLSAEIDRYLLQGNGLLHLLGSNPPDGFRND